MQIRIILILLTIFRYAQIRGDFAEDALKAHNSVREDQGCPALKLDEDLSKECEAYAKTLGEKGKLEPSSLEDYTENLCASPVMPMRCLHNWYSESVKYDFKAPKLSEETKHFTAMIWKSSTTLGIGKFTTKDKEHYVVARYKPKGNIMSELKENVPLPKNKDSHAYRHSTSFGVVAVLILISVFVQ